MSQFKFLPSSPALRVPATRRISLPASQRLSTITEGAQAQDLGRWSRLSALRNSTSSAATHRTPPPPYEWAPEPAVSGGAGNSENNASDDEKLARLRRTWSGATGQRGGWGRLVVLVVVIVALLGLAIGLGVGLTVGRKKSNNGDGDLSDGSGSNNTQPQDNPAPIQQFPLGQYSFLTNLRAQQTNCTSNPATWRCYPYTVFDSSDPSTVQSSQSTFDWLISNTSALYATNTTTSPSNAPANLTISSTNNPFALSFTAQELTYVLDSGSSSSPSPKLTFSFTLAKIVVPTAALTADNAATQCYFNSTVLSGTLYLTDTSGNSVSNATDAGSYETWPYAVEIVQSSKGGQDTPGCFEVVDGAVGARVVEGLEPRGEGEECRCEYRNFG